MTKVALESVVIVHGEHGSVATIHFSDPMRSCSISSSHLPNGKKNPVIYTLIEKRVKKVLNG